MKVFLSWSKELSLEVATCFGEWLPTVIQECSEPFISVEIDKGEPWFEMIRTALAETDIGLVFITPENAHETWLNFEAGALLNKFGKSGVCPILVGVKKSDYTGPMKQLQLTEIDSEADVRGLLTTINKKCTTPLSPQVLERTLDKFWPELEQSIQESVSNSRAKKPPVATRSLEDKVDEILNLTRNLANTEAHAISPLEVWQLTKDRTMDWLNPRSARTDAYVRLVESMMREDEGRERMDQFAANHEKRLERFEKEFGSLKAVRKSDGETGKIVDFAKKDGGLHWVKFEDSEGNVERYTPDEIDPLDG
ncbi:hypothetical protein MOD31_11045 [Paenarthrobacter sp. TYUT067]|uniref:hypothetical protein n=1 Tax=Paenarthrobacter sp. TYUT067 TaxID=2926245 RepID=UPI00202EE725|nr:hypothetical protein [Paenarthrobacter sp. TYUT067]MCM0616561.1 hypothetical protein [Paenarthrobacter sp. TYUT067]